MKVAGVSPEDVAGGSVAALERLGMGEPRAAALSARARSGWADEEMEECLAKGIALVFPWEDDFPEEFKEIRIPPILLYVRGKGIPAGDKTSVVGTRRCTPYGLRCAGELGSALAGAGVTVVSGGASGIDGAAHRGCLDAGGVTVAILGTGADMVYPGSHRSLFAEIAATGALISEYPLGSPGAQWRFPRRNRLIAGLSSRCVVVEAPVRSGAISTARFALEEGREVWAVPGRITENASKGSNSLISDGAMALTDIADFAGIASGSQMSLFPECGSACRREMPSLGGEEALVMGILAEQGEVTVDNIASRGKMSAAAVLRSLGVLSAYGLAFSSGPGRWSPAVNVPKSPPARADRG
jgi:DNA processing protein